MSNKKQSSIDWLVDFFESGVTSREEWLSAKQKAKAMHMKEVVDAYKDGFSQREKSAYFEAKYYNETFES